MVRLATSAWRKIRQYDIPEKSFALCHRIMFAVSSSEWCVKMLIFVEYVFIATDREIDKLQTLTGPPQQKKYRICSVHQSQKMQGLLANANDRCKHYRADVSCGVDMFLERYSLFGPFNLLC